MLLSQSIAHFDVGGVYRRLHARAERAVTRRRDRRNLRLMLEFDEHILRDIGITRDDIFGALDRTRR